MAGRASQAQATCVQSTWGGQTARLVGVKGRSGWGQVLRALKSTLQREVITQRAMAGAEAGVGCHQICVSERELCSKAGDIRG